MGTRDAVGNNPEGANSVHGHQAGAVGREQNAAGILTWYFALSVDFLEFVKGLLRAGPSVGEDGIAPRESASIGEVCELGTVSIQQPHAVPLDEIRVNQSRVAVRYRMTHGENAAFVECPG